MVRIAVLDLTRHPVPMLEGLPSVGEQTVEWIAPAMSDAEFARIDVAEGGAPMPRLDTFDGLLLTGSEFGVYDDTPWMEPLRQLLRDTKVVGKPIFGICFGHQIIADTFGGKAEKTVGGNVVGVRQFDLNGIEVDAHVWHQDQVTQVPPNAKVTGIADYCPVGALEYDFPAASVQFHPEHTKKHISDVFARAQGQSGFPNDAEMAAALASFDAGDVKADLMTEKVAKFFRVHAANL